MRVLHVVDGYPPMDGCAARWCRSLSRALSARGVSVQVFAAASHLDGSGLACGRADLDEGIPVQRVVASPPLYLLRRLVPGWRTRPPSTWSGRLRGLLLRTVADYDVVHAHGVGLPETSWLVGACRRARRPLVYSPALHDPGSLTLSVRRLAESADAVVAFHRGEGDWVRAAVAAVRVEDVPDPGTPHDRSDTSAWRSTLGLTEDDYVAIFPGRADWESGAVTFIDAVRLLRLAGEAIVPVIVNPGPIDDWLWRLWRTTLVPIVGVTVGDSAERSSLLTTADVIVVPANSCPGAIPEGLATETAVLVPEQKDGPWGGATWPRFPAGNPLALAGEMRRLVHTFQARRTASPANGHAAAASEWPSVAAMIEELYRALVAHGAAHVSP